MSVGQIKKDLASLIQNHIRIKESSEIENFIRFCNFLRYILTIFSLTFSKVSHTIISIFYFLQNKLNS